MLFRKCAASAAGVSFLVAAAISMLALPRTAMAVLPPGSFTFTIAPDGAGNVVVSGSGDINIAGGAEGSTSTVPAAMAPALALLLNGPAGANSSTEYTFTSAITGPTHFGTTSSAELATSGSGTFFGFQYQSSSELDMGLPVGYTADTAISNSSTYANSTLSSLGLTPGTYTWTTGSNNTANTITINVSGTPVPEPTLSLLGIGSTMLLRRRRRAF